MENENILTIFMDFFEYSDQFEKKLSNNSELGEKLRNLIIEYRNKLSD
jgi:hypothetical protein